MAQAAKSKLNSSVEQPLPLQSFTDTCFDHQVDRSLLQNAGADALFNVFAAGGFQDHRLNAVEMQQMREH
jgi:hypothetical protein